MSPQTVAAGAGPSALPPKPPGAAAATSSTATATHPTLDDDEINDLLSSDALSPLTQALSPPKRLSTATTNPTNNTNNNRSSLLTLGPSESTPLLWASASSVRSSWAPFSSGAGAAAGRSSIDAARDDDDDGAGGEAAYAAGQRRRPKVSSWRRRTCCLLLAVVAAVALVLATGWASLYFVYIPVRLQRGSGESGTRLSSLHILFIGEDAIRFEMTGLQHVGDPSPVDVIISPSEFQLVPLGDASPPIKGSVQKSLFPPRIPASWEDEDAAIQRSRPDLVIPGQAAAQLSFPGFKIEPGVKWAPLSMNTSLKLTDVGYAAGLISALLGQTGSVQTFFTLRQQSKPIIVIPEVGSWKIPIWTYYTLNATDLFGGGSGNSTSSFNTTAAFNLTVDSQTVDYETVELPDGDSVMLYLLNATLSFSNPFDGKPHEEVTGSTTPLPVITLANPQLAVACALYHEGVRMARIVVDLPAVATGRNTDAIKVFGRSDVEGTDMLMDWIGKYAEGIDTVVVLGEFEVEYRETRPPLPWVESMIENWRFEVLVPGATEEDSLSAFFVMKKSASH